jgi:hypothetical protein
MASTAEDRLQAHEHLLKEIERRKVEAIAMIEAAAEVLIHVIQVAGKIAAAGIHECKTLLVIVAVAALTVFGLITLLQQVHSRPERPASSTCAVNKDLLIPLGPTTHIDSASV